MSNLGMNSMSRSVLPGLRYGTTGIVLLLPALQFIGCTAGKTQPEPGMEEVVQAEVAPQVVEPYRVVERMGKLNETPRWSVGMEPMVEEKGNISYIHTLTMEGGSRPDGCVKSAGDEGRAEFIRQIKDGITAAGQVSDEGGDIDIEATVSFLGNIKLNGLKVAETYWEKFEDGEIDGKPVVKLRCAARLVISKETLNQQLRKATEANAKNAETRKRLLEGQKAFLEQISKEGSAPDLRSSIQPTSGS